MSTGSAAIHNALLKVENVLQKYGRQNNNLTNQETDLSIYVHFIRENTDLMNQPYRTAKLPDSGRKLLHVDETTIHRFLKILYRVAKGNEGVSRQDRIFINQFWSAFQ
jgi:hypothetical protein